MIFEAQKVSKLTAWYCTLLMKDALYHNQERHGIIPEDR